MGSPVDRLGRNLGLVDRRYRLRVVRELGAAPVELWGVDRRKLHHGQVNLLAVMNQFGAERIREARDGVFCAAIGRLERY